MKTTWNNKQGPRDRQAMCLLVPADGRLIQFGGAPIPGICHAQEIGREKKGKWSNETFEIVHAEGTCVISIRQDFETGRYFPQTSWEAAFSALAEKAPALQREAFEAFVRSAMPKHAARWDAAAEAEEEFK